MNTATLNSVCDTSYNHFQLEGNKIDTIPRDRPKSHDMTQTLSIL